MRQGSLLCRICTEPIVESCVRGGGTKQQPRGRDKLCVGNPLELPSLALRISRFWHYRPSSTVMFTVHVHTQRGSQLRRYCRSQTSSKDRAALRVMQNRPGANRGTSISGPQGASSQLTSAGCAPHICQNLWASQSYPRMRNENLSY
jgi:hypothetical protein